MFLSCLVVSILTAVLTFAVIGAIGVALQGDKFGEGSFANPVIFHHANFLRAERAVPVQETPRHLFKSVISLAPKI